MDQSTLNPKITRRRFLQATGIAGAAGAAGLSLEQAGVLSTISKVHAQPAAEQVGQTVITKSFCAQCPARCGIDVYTTNGRSPTASCARRDTTASTSSTTRIASRAR